MPYGATSTLAIHVQDPGVAGALAAAVTTASSGGTVLRVTTDDSNLWKFLDTESTPDSSWTAPSFDDSSWGYVGECSYVHSDWASAAGWGTSSQLAGTYGAKRIWTATSTCGSGPEGNVYFRTTFSVPSDPPASPPPSTPMAVSCPMWRHDDRFHVVLLGILGV